MDKKRVLLVDDDVDLLKMMRLRMESEGYEFIGARDGNEMLETIKTKRPDVILLDIMLPRMDGYTALREMRRQEGCSGIPVIILTAKEKKKIGDLFALEKVAYFVEKPFDVKDLLQKIKTLLGEKNDG